jgi:hypothetical protein
MATIHWRDEANMDHNNNRPNMYKFCPKFRPNVVQFGFDMGCRKYQHEGK